MSDEEMKEMVKRARSIVADALTGPANILPAHAMPLVAAVFSALVSNEQPAWK